MRPAFLALPLALACAPPPPVDVVGELGPSIEILYPENGQDLQLEDDCSLIEPIVVYIEGVELVPPDPDNIVEGQGHWHGGLDLGVPGYCAAFRTYCNDYTAEDLSGGLLTLFVQLQDNGHNPLDGGVYEDQVEVNLIEPGTGCP